MTKKVRAVFDLLGVEPYEKFKIDTKVVSQCKKGIKGANYIIDDTLIIRVITKDRVAVPSSFTLFDLLNNVEIIKLPKKKKLRDVTFDEF